MTLASKVILTRVVTKPYMLGYFMTFKIQIALDLGETVRVVRDV
jgi:hypothetical protein